MKTTRNLRLGQSVLVLVLASFMLVCFLPVLLIFIASFSSEASINSRGFSFFPSEWSLASYEYVFRFGNQLVRSYQVTSLVTISGTLLTLFLTSMFAFSLSRKDFMLRGPLAIFLLITMLFNGGMLGSYLINANILRLRNNILVLFVPRAVTAINCIIMRTFIKSNLPDSLVEAAKIDGADDIYLFFRIVLPIMTPVLAAIGFITSVELWNEWQTALLYIDEPKLATLQQMLMRIEQNLNFMRENLTNLTAEELLWLRNAPSESARMALLMCTLGPILVIYPFFQKYFIRGITIGAVKG